MKQILPELKEINKHLSFARKSFTKNGFRHFTQYVNGLITLNKKTIKQISNASIAENHHSAISRLLTVAKFEQQELENRYLKKVGFLTKNQTCHLIFDDTLVEHNGEKIAFTQIHKDHAGNGFVNGHQFFTAMIYTPTLQLPLFPEIYHSESETKIEMAKNLIEKVNSELRVDSILFDSWYADKMIIKRCIALGINVTCAIKANRNISFSRGKWQKISDIEDNPEELSSLYLDEIKYRIFFSQAKLKSIPKLTFMRSYEWNAKLKRWNTPFHLISTSRNETDIQILRRYRTRWAIEVFHRDIKQNFGFANAYFRKEAGIVRHSIFVVIAYAIVKIFMHLRGISMTIGECCGYIQNIEMDDFVRKIIEIDEKEARIEAFEMLFKRGTAKV